MRDTDLEGIVFSTQKFSIHDGQGIRTLVFLKGCPLRCKWCSNPESQEFMPEHGYNPGRCLGAAACGLCYPLCDTGALELTGEGVIRYDRSKCVSCGKCWQACPAGAQMVYGEKRKVGDIIRVAEADDVFYQRSGGGITLSGGEPMAQPKFSLGLLREARKARISTAMETCGHYPTEIFAEACALLDELIMDVKSLDTAKHRLFTGQGNERVLQNLRHALENFPDLPITVRTPVIPGFNDTYEEILAIRALLPKRPNARYEALTYHRLGQPKYAYIGREWQMGNVTADDAFMNDLRKKLASMDGI